MATWTDNPATTSTHIRAVHINELRTTVNNDRATAQLPAYAWTDGPVGTGTHIRAVHFIELRYAIQDLWDSKNMETLPNWAVGSPPSSSRQISARDINDLRNWVNTFENSPNGITFRPLEPAKAVQGIVSFSYDPGSTGSVYQDPDWCNDLKTLRGPGASLLVRTKIVADPATNTLGSYGYPEYINAIQEWVQQGFGIGGVLPYEFDYVTGGSCPNAALGKNGDPMLNDYIDNYSVRAQSFATALAPQGLTTYWVWNEPNLDGNIPQGVNCPPGNPSERYQASSLSPQNFGALLVKGAQAIQNGANASGTPVTIYAGGMSIKPDDPIGNITSYLDAMYSYVQGKVTSYPWTGLSVNIEGAQTMARTNDVHNQIAAVMTAHNDLGSLTVGEWGIGNTDLQTTAQQDAMRCTYYAISQTFPLMYYFQHPEFVGDPSGKDYGAIRWTQSPTMFLKLGQLPAYGILQSLYQNSAYVQGTCQ